MMFKQYKSIRWLVHTLFWSVYFCIMLLPAMIYKPLAAQVYFTIHFLILFAATYINILFLIKRYFYTEKYRKYILGVFVLWLVSLTAIQLSAGLKNGYETAEFIKLSLGAMIAFSMEFFLLAMYKAAKEWYLKSQRTKELELEKIRAELNLLRTQLDAHFIFNTLNNLYLLVLNKSHKAPDALLMLSDLLSYTIYESHAEKVELSKELGFIENYINLQKLRLDTAQIVVYMVRGNVSGNIEPLILFNFIENTFKHADGLVVVQEQECFIYIGIEVAEGVLVLKTVNGINSASHEQNSENKGVGIYNAKKRLDLAYTDRYDLSIDDSNGEYKLTLTIRRL